MKNLKDYINESVLSDVNKTINDSDNNINILNLVEVFKCLKNNKDLKEYKNIGKAFFSSLNELNAKDIKYNKYYLWMSEGELDVFKYHIKPKKTSVPFCWGVICFNQDSKSQKLYYDNKKSVDPDTPAVSLKLFGKLFGHKCISPMSTVTYGLVDDINVIDRLKNNLVFYEIPEGGKEALNIGENHPIVK